MINRHGSLLSRLCFPFHTVAGWLAYLSSSHLYSQEVYTISYPILSFDEEWKVSLSDFRHHVKILHQDLYIMRLRDRLVTASQELTVEEKVCLCLLPAGIQFERCIG